METGNSCSFMVVVPLKPVSFFGRLLPLGFTRRCASGQCCTLGGTTDDQLRGKIKDPGRTLVAPQALEQAVEGMGADLLRGLGEGGDAAADQRKPFQVVEGDQANIVEKLATQLAQGLDAGQGGNAIGTEQRLGPGAGGGQEILQLML